MDYGYTIVGFFDYQSTEPIILPNHKIPNYRGFSDLNKMFIGINSVSGNAMKRIILPVLYQLKWVHGELDLYEMCNIGGYIKLLDENEKDYFASLPLNHKPTGESDMYKWLNEGDTLDPITRTIVGKSRKDIIIEIEQKYPGLFKPIFINPSVPKLFSPKTPSPIKEMSAPQIVVSEYNVLIRKFNNGWPLCK
jgi:hypothetical protein